MASYNNKDIKRIRRASPMSAARAAALLRQYDGKADRVLEEKCGAVRVYVEPTSVRDPHENLSHAWHKVVSFCRSARLKLIRESKTLIALPLMPTLLIALLTAPVSIFMAMAALLLGCRFGVYTAGECEDADGCVTLI